MSVATLDRKNCLSAVDDAVAACAADAIAVCGRADMQAIVASVATGRDLPFACIPHGPDDLLARDMNAGSDDPKLALTRFLATREHVMDLAEVNGIAFINYVALGLRVRPFTTARSGLDNGALAHGAHVSIDRPSGLRPLIHDDGCLAPALLISNNRFAVHGQSIGARHRMDAGVLGIATLEAGVQNRLCRARLGRWRVRSATWLELAADQPVLGDVDGCQRVLDPPLRFRIVPGALRARICGLA